MLSHGGGMDQVPPDASAHYTSPGGLFIPAFSPEQQLHAQQQQHKQQIQQQQQQQQQQKQQKQQQQQQLPRGGAHIQTIGKSRSQAIPILPPPKVSNAESAENVLFFFIKLVLFAGIMKFYTVGTVGKKPIMIIYKL